MSSVAKELEKLAAVLPGIPGPCPRLLILSQTLDEALDTIQTEDEALRLMLVDDASRKPPRIL